MPTCRAPCLTRQQFVALIVATNSLHSCCCPNGCEKSSGNGGRREGKESAAIRPSIRPPRRFTSNNVIFPPLSSLSLIFCARMPPRQPNDAQECRAMVGRRRNRRAKHQPSHDDGDDDGSDPLWAVVRCQTPNSVLLPSFLAWAM